MPLGATFEPAARPGEFFSGIANAGNSAQSWMNSAQNRRMREAQNEREQEQFDIQKPVMAAKAKADLLQQMNVLDGQQKTEEARSMAYALLPEARQSFDMMMGLKDPDFRVEQARAWLGQFAQLDQVAELKDEMKQRKDAIANVLAETLALKHYDKQLEIAKTGARSREEIAALNAESRENVAGVGAASREAVANTRKDATIASAEIKAKPTVVKLLESLQEAKDGGADEETINALRSAAAKGGNFAPQHLTELEKYMQLKKSAEDRGDAASAAVYEKAIEKKTHITMSEAERAEAATTPAKVAPKSAVVAPTRVAPDAASVNIGGKEYPIFKDKNGNRAYKIDGHFVPIETN